MSDIERISERPGAGSAGHREARKRALGLAAIVTAAAVAVLGPPISTIRTAAAEEKSAPATKTTTPAKTSAGADHQHHGATVAPVKSGSGAQGGTPMTITGEVIDPACFLEAGKKSTGPGHFQCAVDCAKSGQTLAIYDRKADRLYFIAGELPGRNPNDPVLQYIHKLVDVSGSVYHRAQAWGIVITKVVPHRGASASTQTPAPKATTK